VSVVALRRSASAWATSFSEIAPSTFSLWTRSTVRWAMRMSSIAFCASACTSPTWGELSWMSDCPTRTLSPSFTWMAVARPSSGDETRWV